jgi:hypothetical protein
MREGWGLLQMANWDAQIERFQAALDNRRQQRGDCMTPEDFGRRMKELQDRLPGRYQSLLEAHEAMTRRVSQLEMDLGSKTQECHDLQSRLEMLEKHVKAPDVGGALSPAVPGDTVSSHPPASGAVFADSAKFRLEPLPPSGEKRQHPLARWIDAACRYAAAVELARGRRPETSKMVPRWDRDMRLLKAPFQELGARELTRRWVLFCLDSSPFTSSNRTFPFFAGQIDRWRVPSQTTESLEWTRESAALKSRARILFEELYNKPQEKPQEAQRVATNRDGPGTGIVRGRDGSGGAGQGSDSSVAGGSAD